ncbi:MAG: methionine--tRNA ligase [Candidatus Colwellbacteria bacterium]|nr:methionine--tRNA ligase [Candidatus Colwellbacteria bacterium]
MTGKLPVAVRDKFYLTTTLPYVNAPPHIGFALEMVQADILARYNRLLGREVFFNTGTDEHGLKIYRAAQKEGKEPQDYVDEYATKFDRLKEALNLSYNNFIRTTDKHHIKAAQEFWKLCDKNGDIEKKLYQVKYCVECELEKSESELNHGKCIVHPHAEIEIIEEENYFFKFSTYQEKLLNLYKERLDFVVPESRFNEIKKFVERGLEDFSISRLKEKMPWGIPVPGDDEHVMYVWFDALINYISAVGWPDRMDEFEKWWPVVQLAGKDQVRQQAAMWQAMLMSAGIPPSEQIVIHGFITSGGKKMSKSLGNVIDPFEIVDKYGPDAVRYYLARHIHPFEDSDFTEEKFRAAYNAHLANGLGNLVGRIMKMVVDLEVRAEFPEFKKVIQHPQIGVGESLEQLEQYEFNKVMEDIWGEQQGVSFLDHFIQREKPFSLMKSDPPRAKELIEAAVIKLWYIAIMLQPFMPDTAQKIQNAILENKMPEPLFPRLE